MGFLLQCFGAGWQSPMFEALAVPAARKFLPTGGPLRGPPVGRGFRAVGAAGTLNIDDFRPTPQAMYEIEL